MVMFIISSFINMIDSVDFLKCIMPFKYFDGSYILNGMILDSIYIVIYIIIIVAGIGGTFILFPKRNFNI